MESIQQPLTNKFLIYSTIVHLLTAFLIAQYSAPLIQKIQRDIVVIELAKPIKISKGEAAPATQGLKPILVEKSQKVKAQKQIRPVASRTMVAKVKTMPVGKARAQRVASIPTAARAAISKSVIVAPRPVVALPATIDDISDSGEDIENRLSKVAQREAHLSEDFSRDYESVNQKNRLAISKEKNLITQDLDDTAAEAEEHIRGAQKQTAAMAHKVDAARIRAQQLATEEERAAAMEAAMAAAAAEEESAAIAAAEAASAAEAAKALAAQESQKATERQRRTGYGRGNGLASGLGAGNRGSSEYSRVLSGNSNGVRSLDQLRQMPGNARPQYSYQERLKGHQGAVVFWAYVNKEGFLTEFKQVQTTGYSNLDSKTLESLKRWRFYPGQEGWVELPFKWDLKGGPQEMPTLLRAKGRNISVN